MNISEYRERREKLMLELGKGILILPSIPEAVYSNDVHYKYRPHTDLIYFTGFPEPNTILVVEHNDEGIKSHLFVPKRDPEFEIWNGRRYGVKGAIEKFGMDCAYENTEFEKFLEENLVKYETVFFASFIDENIDTMVHKHVYQAILSRDKPSTGPLTVINPIFSIQKQRLVKSPPEIEILRKAAKISADAHTRAMAVTKVGMNEYEIESILDFEFRKNGGSGPAYPSIVGSGVNATILHYVENNDIMNDGELLLVDAATEYKGYAADITRTWPINGKFTEAQREIYQIVLDVQKECIEMIKPGAIFDEITNHCIRRLSENFVNIGLLEGDIDKIIEEKKYKKFFMHGLGHWLGIDTHDTSLVKKDGPMVEGSYITVEPGIYIPTDDDIPEKYRGIGVRIEDDILVTAEGYENLSRHVVKEIDEIEAIVGTMKLP